MVTISTILLLIACNTEPNIEKYRPLLGDWKAFDEQLDVEKKTLDSTTIDLLLLDLAVQEPIFAFELCKKVQTEQAKEKCQQVIGRPHLQQQ